ncbi:hypothetical protein WISP_05158 [Willisornis vidua]|uniref:Uncharacterized protein n=1 Tax=Willisornis vidua TaxID=1566151 RepID=A0ABQ9DXI5_9PASS|nr:hypothetical protein WISP_05158 [Willisornis vidua]
MTLLVSNRTSAGNKPVPSLKILRFKVAKVSFNELTELTLREKYDTCDLVICFAQHRYANPGIQISKKSSGLVERRMMGGKYSYLSQKIADCAYENGTELSKIKPFRESREEFLPLCSGETPPTVLPLALGSQQEGHGLSGASRGKATKLSEIKRSIYAFESSTDIDYWLHVHMWSGLEVLANYTIRIVGLGTHAPDLEGRDVDQNEGPIIQGHMVSGAR